MKRNLAKWLIASAFLLFASTTLLATQVPIEVYGALPDKSLLAISPNAKLLAYRDTSDNKDLLMVINRAENSLVGAARLDGINPNQIYFVSDNVVILVATKNVRIGGYRGRHDSSWAYAYNLETGKIHPLLTQGYGIFDGQTQLGQIVGISEDKKYAYMPAYRSAGSFSLYRVDLERKRKPWVYQRGTSDTVDFFVGYDGELLARERYDNEDDLHRIEVHRDDEWVEIHREVTDIRTKGFHGLTPDYKNLIFSAYGNPNGRLAYYTMSLADGSISGPIFSDDKKDVSHLVMDIHRVVHGASYSGFEPHYEFFDDKLNARMRGLAKALPNKSFAIRDYSSDWQNMIFYMEGENSVGEYVLYSDSSLSMLASSRPDLPIDTVSPIIEQHIEVRDNLVIPTLLTVPRNQKAENLPAIVFPHGGPASYDSKGFNYMAQFFANRGYLVVQPQFRGSSGFGLSFRNAGHGEWGRKMQHDITDTTLTLIEEGKIDPDRVCIVGASYGGYAALAGAVFTPDLFKCVVSINGVSDIEAMMKAEKRDYGSDHWVVSYWENAISGGEVDGNHLHDISPINHVEKVKAPILLIHGEYDEIVPVQQSKEIQDELEDANKEVQYIELDNGDHHLSRADNRMKAMKAIATFIDQHI